MSIGWVTGKLFWGFMLEKIYYVLLGMAVDAGIKVDDRVVFKLSLWGWVMEEGVSCPYPWYRCFSKRKFYSSWMLPNPQ